MVTTVVNPVLQILQKIVSNTTLSDTNSLVIISQLFSFITAHTSLAKIVSVSVTLLGKCKVLDILKLLKDDALPLTAICLSLKNLQVE